MATSSALFLFVSTLTNLLIFTRNIRYSHNGVKSNLKLYFSTNYSRKKTNRRIMSVPQKRIPSAVVYYYCTWYPFLRNRRYTHIPILKLVPRPLYWNAAQKKSGLFYSNQLGLTGYQFEIALLCSPNSRYKSEDCIIERRSNFIMLFTL